MTVDVKRVALPGDRTIGAFLPDYTRICVASHGAQEVTYHDAFTLQETGRTTVPRSPCGLAAVGDNLVIACSESQVLAVVDPKTLQLVDAIPVDFQPSWAGYPAPPGVHFDFRAHPKQ